MTIIVDSDGLIGSFDPDDTHHQTAKEILIRFGKNTRIIYPATVLVESITFFQGRLDRPDLASSLLELINRNILEIESINASILQEASIFMNFKSSKHNTLFDAIVAAVAKKYQADAIFSFDKFYKSKGFKLASEL